MIGGKPRWLIVWVGDRWGRTLKGIGKVMPHRLFAVIERKSAGWEKLQRERLEKIQKRLGQAYRFEELELPENVEEQEFMQCFLLELLKKRQEIQRKYDESRIILDVTSAPLAAQLIAPLAAILFSDENCEFVLQYIKRKGPNLPIMHAAENSSYYSGHKDECNNIAQKSLAHYRKFLAEDEGGRIDQIRFPRFEMDLFGDSLQAQAKQVIFLHVPPSNKKEESTSSIDASFSEDEWQILEDAATERIGESRWKKFDKDRKSRALGIWRSRSIQQFCEMGLVRCRRRGRNIMAKKTPAGDLFIPVVEHKSRLKAYEWKSHEVMSS